MLDWQDFAALFCASLVVIGAAALADAAQSFTMIRGRVLEKGIAIVDLGNGMSYNTPTVSVLLENDDRVFKIVRGTVVEYAVSEIDAQRVNIGSTVEMLVSAHNPLARVVGVEDYGSLKFGDS
ncbi:MAG TPA: hypothetical protein VNI77_01470 [Nitrososphaera sp.]|nr:hypothetical protein [Nitrososphaera sp.]